MRCFIITKNGKYEIQTEGASPEKSAMALYDELNRGYETPLHAALKDGSVLVLGSRAVSEAEFVFKKD